MVERQAALAGLEAAERGDVDARALGDLLEPFLTWSAQHPTKPIMIGEFGVARGWGTPQRAAWLRNAAEVFKANPQIRAALYFESDPDNGDGTPMQQFQLSHDATVLGAATDACWSAAEQALIATVDALHDRATLSDAEFTALSAHYDEAKIFEIILLCGFYRTVSYLANGLALPLEEKAARFPAEI